MDYQLGPGPLQVDQNTIDEKIKGDIGIVENGDVATHAIPSGYYVIWKGDLYVAKTDISSGTTLSTSNLTAKPNGLGADVATLNSKITTIQVPTLANGTSEKEVCRQTLSWLIDNASDLVSPGESRALQVYVSGYDYFAGYCYRVTTGAFWKLFIADSNAIWLNARMTTDKSTFNATKATVSVL